MWQIERPPVYRLNLWDLEAQAYLPVLDTSRIPIPGETFALPEAGLPVLYYCEDALAVLGEARWILLVRRAAQMPEHTLSPAVEAFLGRTAQREE